MGVEAARHCCVLSGGFRIERLMIVTVSVRVSMAVWFVWEGVSVMVLFVMFDGSCLRWLKHGCMRLVVFCGERCEDLLWWTGSVCDCVCWNDNDRI